MDAGMMNDGRMNDIDGWEMDAGMMNDIDGWTMMMDDGGWMLE